MSRSTRPLRAATKHPQHRIRRSLALAGACLTGLALAGTANAQSVLGAETPATVNAPVRVLSPGGNAGGADAQTAAQDRWTASAQAPVAVNAPVRVLSPGRNSGQAQSGAGGAGGRSTARAKAPIAANAPIRVLSPGRNDGGAASDGGEGETGTGIDAPVDVNAPVRVLSPGNDGDTAPGDGGDTPDDPSTDDPTADVPVDVDAPIRVISPGDDGGFGVAPAEDGSEGATPGETPQGGAGGELGESTSGDPCEIQTLGAAGPGAAGTGMSILLLALVGAALAATRGPRWIPLGRSAR